MHQSNLSSLLRGDSSIGPVRAEKIALAFGVTLEQLAAAGGAEEAEIARIKPDMAGEFNQRANRNAGLRELVVNGQIDISELARVLGKTPAWMDFWLNGMVSLPDAQLLAVQQYWQISGLQLGLLGEQVVAQTKPQEEAI